MVLQRYLKLYKVYLICAIKSRLEYKKDAIVGIISFCITNLASFATLMFVVRNIPSLNGWDMYQLGFLYGFSMIPKSLDHLFTDSLWYIGHWYVRNGEIDKYIIKPVNILFQVIAEVFQPEAIGEAILGVTLIAVCAGKIDFYINASVVVMMIVAVIFGSLLFTAMKLITCSVAFWTKRSGQLMSMVYNVCDFVKYPIGIYHPVIKFMLAFIVPFGLAISIPVDVIIMGTYNAWLVSAGIVVITIVALSLGIFIWTRGLRRYESSGS